MTKITLNKIAEAGVVGAGGAGFPTHVKLAAKADTVLINAAECEPLLHKDKRSCGSTPIRSWKVWPPPWNWWERDGVSSASRGSTAT